MRYFFNFQILSLADLSSQSAQKRGQKCVVCKNAQRRRICEAEQSRQIFIIR